jgi:hypothetical protein
MVASEPPPSIAWREHPFVQKPRTSVLVCAGMLVSWWFGWHLLGSGGLLLALLGTLLPLGPYLFPTDYTVGPAGAAERRFWQARRFTWDELEGYDVYRDAVQLVLDPLSVRNRVQKGILLPLRGTDRERLIAVIEHYLPTE